MTTHYDNLQISRTASDPVIKAAYKSLAQKYHPDRFAGSPAEADRIMKLLNEAFAVLSDPLRRKAHDAWIAQTLTTIHEQAASNPLPTPSKSVSKPSSEECVLEPSKVFAAGACFLGFAVMAMGFEAWFFPVGRTTFSGSYFGLPEEFWHLFFQFVGLPFGLFVVGAYGNILLTGSVITLDPLGMRLSMFGRLYKWSDIHSCEGFEGKLLMSGVRHGKKWKKQLSFRLFADNPEYVVKRICDFKQKYA